MTTYLRLSNKGILDTAVYVYVVIEEVNISEF